MVCTESRISKPVIKLTDCDVRLIGSCGTSNEAKKGTLKFGVRNAQDQIIPVALEVLLVRNLGANTFSVGENQSMDPAVSDQNCCGLAFQSS